MKHQKSGKRRRKKLFYSLQRTPNTSQTDFHPSELSMIGTKETPLSRVLQSEYQESYDAQNSYVNPFQTSSKQSLKQISKYSHQNKRKRYSYLRQERKNPSLNQFYIHQLLKINHPNSKKVKQDKLGVIIRSIKKDLMKEDKKDKQIDLQVSQNIEKGKIIKFLYYHPIVLTQNTPLIMWVEADKFSYFSLMTKGKKTPLRICILLFTQLSPFYKAMKILSQEKEEDDDQLPQFIAYCSKDRAKPNRINSDYKFVQRSIKIDANYSINRRFRAKQFHFSFCSSIQMQLQISVIFGKDHVFLPYLEPGYRHRHTSQADIDNLEYNKQTRAKKILHQRHLNASNLTNKYKKQLLKMQDKKYLSFSHRLKVSKKRERFIKVQKKQKIIEQKYDSVARYNQIYRNLRSEQALMNKARKKVLVKVHKLVKFYIVFSVFNDLYMEVIPRAYEVILQSSAIIFISLGAQHQTREDKEQLDKLKEGQMEIQINDRQELESDNFKADKAVIISLIPANEIQLKIEGRESYLQFSQDYLEHQLKIDDIDCLLQEKQA